MRLNQKDERTIANYDNAKKHLSATQSVIGDNSPRPLSDRPTGMRHTTKQTHINQTKDIEKQAEKYTHRVLSA